MTTSKNRVQLSGHLGSDPELKTIESGRKLAKFSIATHESYKNNKGDTITETHWHYVTAWGKMAEFIQESLHKGTEVAIEGKLQSRSYTDKDGQKRYYTDVQATEIHMILRSKNTENTEEG